MTSGRPAAARKRPRDRRDHILAAAAERFAEYGWAAAGMEDIAADVGITAGAIYRHFPSKEDLLAAVSRQAGDRLVAAAGDGSLRQLVTAVVELAATDTSRLVVLLRDQGGREALGAELVQPWSRALRREGSRLEADRVAHRLWAMVAALCEMARPAGGPVQHKQIRLLTDAFVAYWLTPAVRSARPEPVASGWRPPESRADRILAAAVTLFRERGYDAVGVDDIAAAVGMAPSGIYRFYPSKADILLDAYDLVVARVITEMEQVMATAGGPLAAFEEIVALQVRAALDSVNLIAVTARERHALPAADRPRLARRRRKIMETYLSLLGALRPELDPRQARLLLLGLQPLIREAASSSLCPPDPVGEVAALALALLLGPARQATEEPRQDPERSLT